MSTLEAQKLREGVRLAYSKLRNVPNRTFIFAELARVVRPGGFVYAAELILREALPQAVQADETNWFA